MAFYSNKKILFNDGFENIIYKDKIESAMFRVRKGLSFSLIDTSNKYLSYATKTPIISALSEENYSSEKIKREIQSNLEKLNKENLINSEGSLMILTHNYNNPETITLHHSGNSVVFFSKDNKCTYKKELFVNSLGEIFNGIGSKKSLKFSLKKDKIGIENGTQITSISDGFPIRLDKNEIILRGVFLSYELEKVILKTNKLEIEKRYLVFESIIKLSKLFEDIVFEFFPNISRINLSRESAYNIMKIFKEITFSPLLFFLKSIELLLSKENRNVYNIISKKIENPTKQRIISFIMEGVFRLAHIDTSESEFLKVKGFFEQLNIYNIFEEFEKEIYFLKNYKNTKKITRDLNLNNIKITEEEKRVYQKIVVVLVNFFDNLIDTNVKAVITSILEEIYSINLKNKDINIYWDRKIKIFESLQTTKEQLWANQNSMQKKVVLDLEPLIKKFLILEPFSDDFSIFFYDIERTSYKNNLICTKKNLPELLENINNNTDKNIQNDEILKIREFLLYHPKIEKIKNYTDEIVKNKRFLDKLLNSNNSDKTTIFEATDLNDVFKKLGIDRKN